MQLDIPSLNQRFENELPHDIVAWAQSTFTSGLVLTSSFGAESALMLHLATKVNPTIPVILLDTDYLFVETYVFIQFLTKHFNLNLHVFKALMSPSEMESRFGKLWEQGPEGIKKYNEIRKVEPMERALKKLNATAWISGGRASQTIHRSTLRVVNQRRDGMYKIYPILGFTNRDIALYFKLYGLPFHPLVYEGYSSIGDYHSTKPSLDRSGRFFGLAEECEIHTTNLVVA